METEEEQSESVLISARRRRRTKKKSSRSGSSGDVVVHKEGLRAKKKHLSKQIHQGEGFSVDVADESSFKHYMFVNADEYELFSDKRRLMQLIVCYQVLTTHWNSSSCKQPTPLKPRYLFLFDDALFVMKVHDVVDTHTKRYKILGRLNLHDISVEEVGEDMFDVVGRGIGALRFKVGSGVTKVQMVEILRECIRRRQGKPTVVRDKLAPPSDPDDVYETMNFALAVLEKKMRGTATEEEQWQVDELLRHALEMQQRLGSDGPATLTSVTRTGSNTTTTTTRSVKSSISTVMNEQLTAKEAQLRAMEERATAAEAALSRLRGQSADDGHSRNLEIENRTLKAEVDKLRSMMDDKERRNNILREELEALKRATRKDGGDKAYHEGSVDDVLSRIRDGSTHESYKPRQFESSTTHTYQPSTRDSYQSYEPKREHRAVETSNSINLVQQHAPAPSAPSAMKEEKSSSADETSDHKDEGLMSPHEQRSKGVLEEEREAVEEEKARASEPAVSSPPSSNYKYGNVYQEVLQTKKEEETRELESSSEMEETIEEVSYELGEEERDAAEDTQVPAAPESTPNTSTTQSTLAPIAARSPPKVEEGEEGEEEEIEGEEETTLTSEEFSSLEASPLEEFLEGKGLKHLFKPLDKMGVSLVGLHSLDFEGIKALGLEYADTTNLAHAVGCPVTH